MKKVILIVGPLILVGGGIIAAGLLGVVQIPGLSPKKSAVSPAMYGETKDLESKKDADPEPAPSLAKTQPTATQTPKTVEPETDPVQGAKKIAKLWNEIETDKLVAMSGALKDDELVPVIANMASEKASALLSALDAKRAAKISLAIQREASIVRND